MAMVDINTPFIAEVFNNIDYDSRQKLKIACQSFATEIGSKSPMEIMNFVVGNSKLSFAPEKELFKDILGKCPLEYFESDDFSLFLTNSFYKHMYVLENHWRKDALLGCSRSLKRVFLQHCLYHNIPIDEPAFDESDIVLLSADCDWTVKFIQIYKDSEYFETDPLSQATLFHMFERVYDAPKFRKICSIFELPMCTLKILSRNIYFKKTLMNVVRFIEDRERMPDDESVSLNCYIYFGVNKNDTLQDEQERIVLEHSEKIKKLYKFSKLVGSVA